MQKIADRNHPFTENLRKIIESEQISIEDLSRMSKIKVDDLIKILYNKKVVGPDDMVRLAKALKTDMNTLLKMPEEV